jgi:hypothetical protein
MGYITFHLYKLSCAYIVQQKWRWSLARVRVLHLRFISHRLLYNCSLEGNFPILIVLY